MDSDSFFIYFILTVFIILLPIILVAIMLLKGRLDKLEKRVRPKASKATHPVDRLFEQVELPFASDDAPDSNDSKILTQGWFYEVRRDFMRDSSIKVASLPCFLVYSEGSDEPTKITESPFPKLIIKSSKKNGLQVFFLSGSSKYFSNYKLFFGFGDEVFPLRCGLDSSFNSRSYVIDKGEDIALLLSKISSNKSFFIEYEEETKSEGCQGVNKQCYFESLSLFDLSFVEELSSATPSYTPGSEKELVLGDLDSATNRLAF